MENFCDFKKIEDKFFLTKLTLVLFWSSLLPTVGNEKRLKVVDF